MFEVRGLWLERDSVKDNNLMRKASQAGKRSQEKRWQQPRLACGGSGRYDAAGSPRCAACGGTGKQVRS